MSLFHLKPPALEKLQNVGEIIKTSDTCSAIRLLKLPIPAPPSENERAKSGELNKGPHYARILTGLKSVRL
jgi:hypothetical protein